MNIAAILAGGSGKRFGENTPKQFLALNGKLVIEYSIEVFQQHADIDEIILVVPSDYVSKCTIFTAKYSKVKTVIQGGSERYLSTLAVLDYYKNNDQDILILHDAARPMISQLIISNILKVMQSHQAATVAVETTDTIIQSLDNQTISNVFDRSTLFNVQTPQAFRMSVLKNAFQIAMQHADFKATDDTAIVFNYLPKEKIAIVKGCPTNIKLTHLKDLRWLEKYMDSNL